MYNLFDNYFESFQYCNKKMHFNFNYLIPTLHFGFFSIFLFEVIFVIFNLNRTKA